MLYLFNLDFLTWPVCSQEGAQQILQTQRRLHRLLAAHPTQLRTALEQSPINQSDGQPEPPQYQRLKRGFQLLCWLYCHKRLLTTAINSSANTTSPSNSWSTSRATSIIVLLYYQSSTVLSEGVSVWLMSNLNLDKLLMAAIQSKIVDLVPFY